MNIIRPSRTASKIGASLPTLWRWVKDDPDFPQPVKMSGAITGFVESEVDAYIERKVSESRANPTKRTTASAAAAASVKVRADRRQAERQEAHHAQV
jgi:prophage regulatory protein